MGIGIGGRGRWIIVGRGGVRKDSDARGLVRISWGFAIGASGDGFWGAMLACRLMVVLKERGLECEEGNGVRRCI